MLPKFRAMGGNGVWFYSDDGIDNVFKFTPAYALQFFWSRINSGAYLVATLGQWSHRHLKNRDELWEGDRIEGTATTDINGKSVIGKGIVICDSGVFKVRWDEDCQTYWVNEGMRSVGTIRLPDQITLDAFWKHEDWKIIGTIHDKTEASTT